MICSRLYKKKRGDLESAGFVINSYDPCIANKMINGSQMTITWHVDDLKILHKNGWKTTKLIKWLEKIHGNIKIKRGRKHGCLGMDLDFEQREGKAVNKSICRRFYKKIPEELSTFNPSQKYEGGKTSSRGRSHTISSHCCTVIVCKHESMYEHPACCSFSRHKGKMSWSGWSRKLKRVIKYLNGTRNLKLTPLADNLGIIHWFVDASYAIHDDW